MQAVASVVDGDGGLNGKKFFTSKLCLIVVPASHENCVHIFTITLFIIGGE